MAMFSLQGCLMVLAAILTFSVWRIVYNLYLHPLSHFPGPKLAASRQGESLGDLRVELHRQYGAPKSFKLSLHFSNPAAHNDIYNHRNKWDKDHLLYRAFDLDMSTVGFIHYSDAKHRRDVLVPFFSRTSVLQMQDVVQERESLATCSHCFSVDVVMAFRYAKDWNATTVPEFQCDIVLASQAVLPVITMRKYSSTLVKMMRYISNWFGKEVGSSEAAALLGTGSDSSAIAATAISYHVLHNPEVQQRLVDELRTAWPVLEEVPRYEVLEKLPYLASLLQTAVVKEGLRMFPGGTALPRVVPPEGATIGGTFIPGGVSTGYYQWFLCVLRSSAIFSDPDVFIPDRWLGEDAKTLEAWLVSFSKGPRSCLGINLAYCELYLVIAGLFRRFDLTLDPERSGDMTVGEHFVPVFTGPHLHAYCKPVSD
ncbi:putative P450 monooxygenase [Lactarius hengduanensis]|nr:putative P450 monooxygenase [Lactarius hengduanensis]